jgi:hypothetical protein
MPDSLSTNFDQKTDGLSVPAKPLVNKALWRALLLPSLIILALSVGAYLLLPVRDAFLSGQTEGNYLLLSIFSVASPYFWTGGIAAVVFFLMLLLSIARTAARKEWGYWQRLLGLIALTASGIMFGWTGLPEFGVSSRDAGSVTFGNYNYHLFVQTMPATPGTNLRMSIFVCDPPNIACQRFHRADLEYQSGERIPPLDQLRIQVDGIFVVVRSNSQTILTKIQP